MNSHIQLKDVQTRKNHILRQRLKEKGEQKGKTQKESKATRDQTS
jgi:hypothetical protein